MDRSKMGTKKISPDDLQLPNKKYNNNKDHMVVFYKNMLKLQCNSINKMDLNKPKIYVFIQRTSLLLRAPIDMVTKCLPLLVEI